MSLTQEETELNPDTGSDDNNFMEHHIRKGIDPFSQSFFSLQNRICRSLWGLTYILLFRPSPRPFHFWRAMLLRLFGAEIADDCHVYARARIWAPWNLKMGARASLADDVNCYTMAPIYVGAEAIVSQGAHLCTGTHDYCDPNFQLYAKPITIGDKAWIGAEAFVLPGVTIGEGAVIGARAVVTKDMPPWTVCAGHPCKPLKPRRFAQPVSPDEAA